MGAATTVEVEVEVEKIVVIGGGGRVVEVLRLCEVSSGGR